MFSSAEAEVEVKFDHRICRKNAQLVTDLQISLLSNRYIRMFSNCLLPVVVTSMTQAVITLLQGWWRYNKLVSTSLISSARNKLLYGLPNRTDLIKLQRVQNAAARLVTSTRKYTITLHLYYVNYTGYLWSSGSILNCYCLLLKLYMEWLQSTW
jgi:hypothetical protein